MPPIDYIECMLNTDKYLLLAELLLKLILVWVQSRKRQHLLIRWVHGWMQPMNWGIQAPHGGAEFTNEG